MTVEIDHVLGAEDVRQVIETAEQAGSVRASELTDLVEAHELGELEAEALHLDREELPQPGPALPRPDPGGNARPDPRRREVRLAPRLQVLDLRHMVDPPGGRPCARRQGADDPDAGAHRRAPPEDEQGRADAL